MKIEFCCEGFEKLCSFYEISSGPKFYRFILRERDVCPCCGAKIEITVKGEKHETG
jgi:hypothetical protein